MPNGVDFMPIDKNKPIQILYSQNKWIDAEIVFVQKQLKGETTYLRYALPGKDYYEGLLSVYPDDWKEHDNPWIRNKPKKITGTIFIYQKDPQKKPLVSKLVSIDRLKVVREGLEEEGFVVLAEIPVEYEEKRIA